MSKQSKASELDQASRLVCRIAGEPRLIDRISRDLARRGVRSAIRRRDTPVLFDWLLETISYQGIGNHVAHGYMERHGRVRWTEIAALIEARPSCPKLQSYWHFDHCGYQKVERCCAEPDHFPACPLPTHDMRNGRLNQAAYSLFLAKLFDYVMAAVHRHRPDLDDIGLATVLRELGRADHLSVWLRGVLRYADLVPPPWDGTETIAPMRTVGEIHTTGVELRNCLLGDDRVLPAVLGQCCYYRVSGRHGPAVVSVTFDALLGAWRIESYRGPANALLKPAAERHILEAFAAAGIRFFGDYPRERALDGWDD